MDAPVSAKAALLQALDLPGCGVALAARVRERTGGHVRLRPGSVYPALRALQREGLLRSLDRRPSSVGRPRRYYELTPRGVAKAMAQREALAAFFTGRRGAPSDDAGLMADRMLKCAEISAFVLGLRRAALSVR